jgi:chemotaxis protein MotA
MLVIIGFIVVTGSILGGYVLHHGNLAVLYQPTEYIIIGGAAVGALIVSSSPKVLKDILKSFSKLLSGGGVSKKTYMELLGMLYNLFSKIRKEGVLAVEADIEDPKKSKFFAEYPNVMKNHHAMEFIIDNLRVFVIGIDPMELEEMMDMEIETHHEEAMQAPTAITGVGDALPGFGIVAAVLGIVITMGKMSEGPEAIGRSVAAALVGTFLGILLAYGYVGPIATNLTGKVAEEAKIYEAIKVAIVSFAKDMPPQMAVEAARRVLFSNVKPTFSELEDSVRKKKKKK